MLRGLKMLIEAHEYSRDLAVENGAIMLAEPVKEFQASTLFLGECWRHLTSDPALNERLHLVTGTVTRHGVMVLSRMEQMGLEEQTPVYVSANEQECHDKMLELDLNHGHKTHAMFHSHISRGAPSTWPSTTDRDNQKRYEKAGLIAVGGIFSLDGYMRFFTNSIPFDIEVYGRGALLLCDEPLMKVFKLDTGGHD